MDTGTCLFTGQTAPRLTVSLSVFPRYFPAWWLCLGTMDSKFDIPLRGPSVNIVRRCGSALSDVLQSKFGCVATIDGVDFERGLSTVQQRGPSVVPEKRFAVTLHGGVQVSVWKADLTNFQADAVVNAANDQLHHYGGLALALSMAGGPQIQRDSDDYISKYGGLKTGDAIVCDAGSLPCKKIIHAVGPYVSKYPLKSDVSAAKQLLERAIMSILDRVKENRLQSVAIPAISSGLFNYPLPDCAKAIVTTVKHYYESSGSSGHLPKEIFLVNNDEPTVKEMNRACLQLLTNRRTRGDAKTSTPTVQLGNVHLTLKRGKIEEQHTDVIVNTASPQRDLNIGEISRALLQRAGPGMQQEIYNVPQTGHVIVTNPYKLQCKQVYHTFCTEKWKDPAQQRVAQQILFKSVSECLWLAAAKHKSIAFPAIGTGALGFDKKEVAQIMSNAVADFAQNAPQKFEVHFVIFPSDNDTFKAFEEQFRYLQQKASDPNFTHVDVMMSSQPAFEHRDDFQGDRALTPQISLIGPSDETTREAERWLSGLLFQTLDTVAIRNNFIQHFGEKEHLQLSRLIKGGVSIEESFENGRAGITVKGNSTEDVVVAGLQVEAMLCNIQKEFVTEEERAMLCAVLPEDVSFERKTVDRSSPEFSERSSAFKKHGLLRILKLDKVENPALNVLFAQKKNQLCCFTPQTMFQRIPAQFCEMVSHIGFHAEYAPPDEPKYGEGIYFAGTVEKAMEVWKGQKEEYLHFVEAKVLTGNATSGKPGLILPPAVGTDPPILYDSVSGERDISVIFSGYQALPTYIITCKVV
ncbi:protein mono-ADP-ribosyltransferase PARP9 isoform X2 [Perca fluviatilis]|uniref:protein mono-ADP-ribosyltransferase PARP9 isoform X2 n=1 Tax=Perca fluviatilis TaxID=8168 RepID=UPI00196498E3|nr:protein mono-ADP-ribosyltransferase PARP9 isoform X2 [Perca fluviatilis]